MKIEGIIDLIKKRIEELALKDKDNPYLKEGIYQLNWVLDLLETKEVI